MSWLNPALPVQRSALAPSKVYWLAAGAHAMRSAGSISCHVEPSLLDREYWLTEVALAPSGLVEDPVTLRKLLTVTAWPSGLVTVRFLRPVETPWVEMSRLKWVGSM